MEPEPTERAWAEARELVDAAYSEVAPAARRLGRKAWFLTLARPNKYRDLTVTTIGAARADPRDRHLATAPAGSGEYWHPAAQWDDRVTPGYTWALERAVARRGTVSLHHVGITLTIDDTGRPVLRSGPHTRPATREGWTELSARILGPVAGLPATDQTQWVGTMLGDLWCWLRDLVSDGLSWLGHLLFGAIPIVLILVLIGVLVRCTS